MKFHSFAFKANKFLGKSISRESALVKSLNPSEKGLMIDLRPDDQR